ncbi:hypothetical protein B0H17DRAFT_1136579 [Mycena rosella]|uniref:Uncharacterized protein n=1 Tax=Mycena rosella TaxID=1033263 RepID=A0AAD7DAV9_MYCRO|nr:hypothetical protein B0H17DRAFT_1136579 [Mycena rosella]
MSHPSSVPLLLAREGEVLRRRDATLPVDFPGSDAAFAAALTTAMAWTLWGGTTDIATGPEVLRRCSSTLTVDFAEAGPIVCLANTFQEGDRLLSMSLTVCTVDLLPLYLEDRDPLAVDDPTTVQTDLSRLSFWQLGPGKHGIERTASARQLDRTKPSNFQNWSYSMSCDNHQSKPAFVAILEVLVMGSAVWNMKYERSARPTSLKRPHALGTSYGWSSFYTFYCTFHQSRALCSKIGR